MSWGIRQGEPVNEPIVRDRFLSIEDLVEESRTACDNYVSSGRFVARAVPMPRKARGPQ